jgi:hypothetical protein
MVRDIWMVIPHSHITGLSEAGVQPQKRHIFQFVFYEIISNSYTVIRGIMMRHQELGKKLSTIGFFNEPCETAWCKEIIYD